jgi:hypothetical protein
LRRRQLVVNTREFETGIEAQLFDVLLLCVQGVDAQFIDELFLLLQQAVNALAQGRNSAGLTADTTLKLGNIAFGAFGDAA